MQKPTLGEAPPIWISQVVEGVGLTQAWTVAAAPLMHFAPVRGYVVKFPGDGDGPLGVGGGVGGGPGAGHRPDFGHGLPPGQSSAGLAFGLHLIPGAGGGAGGAGGGGVGVGVGVGGGGGRGDGGGAGGGRGAGGEGGAGGGVVHVPLGPAQLPSVLQDGQCADPKLQQVHFLSQSLVLYVPVGSAVQVGLQMGVVAG